MDIHNLLDFLLTGKGQLRGFLPQLRQIQHTAGGDGDGFNLLGLGYIAHNTRRVQPQKGQGSGKNRRHGSKTQKHPEPKHLYGLGQEHLSGVKAQHQACNQQNIGALGEKGAHKGIQHSGHAQGIHRQEHRGHPPDGDKVPGGFQIPPPVQKKGQGKEGKTHPGTYQQVYPVAVGGA